MPFPDVVHLLHSTEKQQMPLPSPTITPVITVLNVFIVKENAWHSLAIKAREGTEHKKEEGGLAKEKQK